MTVNSLIVLFSSCKKKIFQFCSHRGKNVSVERRGENSFALLLILSPRATGLRSQFAWFLLVGPGRPGHWFCASERLPIRGKWQVALPTTGDGAAAAARITIHHQLPLRIFNGLCHQSPAQVVQIHHLAFTH